MMGRYGHDQLNRFLMILALITVLLGMVVAWKLFSILTFALLVLAYFRMFSRNIAARRRENEMFLARTAGVRKRLLLGKRQWQDRKTHVFRDRQLLTQLSGILLRIPGQNDHDLPSLL